jgi:ribosomal protein L17
MSDALRALLYAFHEDLARRRATLPLLLNERATRHLVRMVSQLAERAGNYATRIQTIGTRAGTE